MQNPPTLGVVENGILEQRLRGQWRAKLISAALLTAEGDEEPRAVVNKGRWRVRQDLS